MGYPVVYRQNANTARRGGYQRPASRVPANDNRPRAPVVRIPNTPPWGFPHPSARNVARAAFGFARFIWKIYPPFRWISTILDLIDLIEMWRAWGPMTFTHPGGTKVFECAAPEMRGPIPDTPLSCGLKPLSRIGVNSLGDYHMIGPHVAYDFLGFSLGELAASYDGPPPDFFPSGSGDGMWKSPVAIPSTSVEYIPSVWITPSVDPFSLPIGQPVPRAEPLPWPVIPHRQPNPWRSPYEQTQRGPVPVSRQSSRAGDPRGFTRPAPGASPWSQPRVNPTPRGVPSPVAKPGVGDPVPRVDPKVDPRVRPEPGAKPDPRFEHRLEFRGSAPPRQAVGMHVRRPPGRGVKERKFIANATGAVLRIFGTLTELDDFVDALYWAIPKHLRPKGKQSFMNKWKAVYKNFADLDFNEALKNIIENEIKDRLYGKAGRIQARANRELRISGVGFGRVQGQLRRTIEQ